MKVSVIIPNYNGIKFLKGCLDSLENQTFDDFETIVVDNASCDNSIDFISSNYQDVKIIKLNENYGFSRAVNEGIKASKSDYVLLLNNDTVCEPDFISNLFKFIKKRPKCFSVASKMIQLYDKNLLDSAGDLYTIIGWAVNRGNGMSSKLYNQSSKIFTACAGASIYRKKIFDEIGYFDENHFAYLEDIDIGYRAKIYGYNNYYCPQAKVYHAGSATSGSKYNSFKVKLSARNSVYLNYKNMPLWQLILNFIPLTIGYIVKYAYFVKKGYAKDYVGGVIEGLKTRHKCTKVKNKNVLNYLKIELELIKNTFIYIKYYLKR